ncbi:helix-turn-helix domain-containing protein [Deinococcus frigens]|uniref:helix-turn-helix domain-containing protein n=1 Tax=Deinococcus frigens TaxID=249403 RepID=UPI0006905E9A|nr:helix-turn-helix domain-containing protein [Deinococcus frigens]
MTNFTEITRSFQELSGLAPEFFMDIRSDEELSRATAFLYHFDFEVKGEGPHPLDPLADILMQKIAAYEAVHFPMPGTDGPDMLAFMLEQRPLTQKALAEASGIPQSTLSDLIHRKRDFTADHARRLGEFFRVSPGIFL